MEKERMDWKKGIRKKVEWSMSEKKSLCCNANMKLDVEGSDIGMCSKCNKICFNKAKESRLSKNRQQDFKKIADDGLYNNYWNKKKPNYMIINRNKI
tara:strand:+ start:346 stop:636 length:291 start_codon:yes stop_codon:yes gene_type:complete